MDWLLAQWPAVLIGFSLCLFFMLGGGFVVWFKVRSKLDRLLHDDD